MHLDEEISINEGDKCHSLPLELFALHVDFKVQRVEARQIQRRAGGIHESSHCICIRTYNSFLNCEETVTHFNHIWINFIYYIYIIIIIIIIIIIYLFRKYKESRKEMV